MPTILKLAAGIANEAAVLPWHWMQFVVVLCAFAWVSVSDGITEKSALLWQAPHAAVGAYGMWLDGMMMLAVNGCMTLWQAPHSSVVAMCVGPLPIAWTLLWQELQVPSTFR